MCMSTKTIVPKISIDTSRCTTPFACKKCLEVCPQGVFGVMAIKNEMYKETDPNEPGAYLLMALLPDRCVMCGDCINVCPVDALKITAEE
jgi:ferredoxin